VALSLERRHRRQAPGEPRERRRPRWGEFREAYPRIVAAMVVGLVALVAIDGVLAFKRWQYGRETARLRGQMTEVERRRTDAIVESSANRTQLMVALARRDAVGDTGLNLAVSADKGTMYLQREGAQLREMPVKIGPEATVGAPPDEVRLAAPLGKRVVVRVVDSSYAWQVPAWVWTQRGQTPPADRRIEGALGSVAILLDGGAVIYSRPATGPLADDAHVLPGGVRAEAADLEAIRENLTAGMAAYFY
jgi:hypothetical protein